ncbi:uncharacterized protein KIAA2012 homolog isoform X2 [Eleutherodactylus coqui]|uniref:uncharacterized protein KIAA2012 homolog isoform X2 n=1 Tax=Eleutherodactylus coqui TaxID=57060 RepID=UPI00346221AF
MSTLSLLSRGNAQVVRTTQEKLVIHYEPEDYFNWKSRHDFHIRRFLSGRYTSNRYWALPTHKTYSTRKGALVLYSEDLALPAWNVSQIRRAKKRQRYRRKNYQMELSTLQDLTGAILSYGRKQKDHTEPYWQPYLHFLNEEDVQCGRQIRPGYSPKRYLTRLFRTWDPNTVYKLQQAGNLRDSVQLQQLAASGDGSGRHPDLSSTPLKYHRLPVFTSLPYLSGTDVFTRQGHCTPVEEESRSEEELAYDKEILEIYGNNSTAPNTATLRKSNPEQRESHVTQSVWKVKEKCNSHMGEAQHNRSSGDDTMSSMTDWYEKPPAAVDGSFWNTNYAPNHGKPHATFYGGPFSGQRKHLHSKQQKDYVEYHSEGGFLPPISQSFGPEEVLKHPNTKVQESLKLPRIIEEPSNIPQRKRRRRATDPPKELLVIPLLVHFENQKVTQEEQTGMNESSTNGIYYANSNEEPASGISTSEDGFNEKQVDPTTTIEVPTAATDSRFRTLQMDINWNLDPNTDDDLVLEVPPVGLLPPIHGKKGPGNQSSMANLKASNTSNNASAINSQVLPTGIIRGSLPEELKECCKGSSVGSLIMGPDGEIVCLSLMGATRDADIPIRFDFIPELEEGDCLPVESTDQEEQWSFSQQDAEKEQDHYNSPSYSDPTNTSERLSTPPHRRGKRGKLKNSINETSLQEESDEMSVQEFGQHRFAEENQKGNKGDVRNEQKTDKQKKRTEKKSDHREKDIGERDEDKSYSEDIYAENGDEASSTSTDDFQDQDIEEGAKSDQNMQNKNEQKLDQEEKNVHGTDQQISVHGTDQQRKNGQETDQQIQKENQQPSSDATNIRPKPSETQSGHEGASPGLDTSRLQESTDSDPSAPSAGQDQSVQVITGSGKQPNVKYKTSRTTKTQNPEPSGKTPEIFKDVEKVISEREENLPVIPQQTEINQESNHIEKRELTEEEELALLQEITSTVTKETTKGKGKKKEKSEKVQKAEKAQASPARKANQKAGAKQGKAAFLVGLPKNKKGESKISYPKKPSEEVMMEETVPEAQEKPEGMQGEDDNDTGKESEDSYVFVYHERSPTPTQSEDHSESDPTPKTSEQESGQAADSQVTATLEVTSQANEDDNASSGMSEVTSSSVRQRRSSRALEISERAERKRLEVERKRREREEQLRLEKEQQDRLDRMTEELEQEQLRRVEEIRVRKQQEEKEKQRQEQERARKMLMEQQALERARQQQEEHRRKLQEIQRRKQQEELERTELERQRQKEQERLEAEECLRLLEMAAEEREEYQRKKREREEQARQEAEERRLKEEEEAKAIMEEAHRQAQLLAKQAAALEQQLQFNRGLLRESVGMDQTQGVSRPWVFSYFEFLELLGLPLPVEGE